MGKLSYMLFSGILALSVSCHDRKEVPAAAMTGRPAVVEETIMQEDGPARTLEVVAETALDESVDDPEAEANLSDILELVPDAIQRRMNTAGGKVMLFEGRIRDIDEIKDLEKKTNTPLYCTTKDIEKADGVYVQDLNTSYVRNDPFTPRLALHEYGHMVDHVLGDRSLEADFLSIYISSKAEHGAAFDKNAHRKYGKLTAREFFAECFAEYYLDPLSWEGLKSDFPEAHEYFRKLEKNIVKGSEQD